ncbi:hypothetical protein AWB76_07628 [Caballeronia temeraria]|uniref:Uncharacterized protein n=1 Tax=Caballeronia temeraria TaxID=1777137 RepID=A0A158DWP2_9BURK|nr:hypothetical protein AWB76_07628 [Caballeronia temeraria]
MQRFADDDARTKGRLSSCEVQEIVDRNFGANADCHVSVEKRAEFSRAKRSHTNANLVAGRPKVSDRFGRVAG